MARLGRGPPTLHLPGRGTRLVQRLSDRPAAAAVGHGHERAGGRGVIGEPRVSCHDLAPHALRDTTFDRRSPRRGLEVTAGRRACAVRRVGIDDGPPACAATQVCEQRLLDRGFVVARYAALPQALEPHHDARRAESALARTTVDERFGPAVTNIRVEPFDRLHLASGHAPNWSHARHPRLTVDEHGAATTLTLRAAAVLRRTHAELVTEHVE